MSERATAMSARPHAASLARVADALAIAVAVSLPWSTSATGILVGLWLLAVVPTMDFAALRRTISVPAAALPVLLVVLAGVGMLWASAPWGDRLDGVSAFVKLAAIPLLMVQFRESDWGQGVLAGFLMSSGLLLALSWALVLTGLPDPSFPWQPKQPGIPVKDYISQSGIFAACAFALFDYALLSWRAGRKAHGIAGALIACVFLANIFFVATSRTTLVVIPILLVLLGALRLRAKEWLALVISGCLVAALVWASSPYARFRVLHLVEEVQEHNDDSLAASSAGYRLEFWRMSSHAMLEAPVIGHGTGSISQVFHREGSASALNPHNQIFAVGIQLGVVGIAVLLVMWVAQWRLFFDTAPVAWPGLVVVTQNIVSSLFNSHLSDFTQGWMYVFAVGVVGGMLLRGRAGEGAGPADEMVP